MATLTLKVNGRSQQVDVDPSTPLLYVLSDDLELRGPKFGCGLGQCGACTVIVNGVATRSCVTPTSAVRGEVTTLERNGAIERIDVAGSPEIFVREIEDFEASVLDGAAPVVTLPPTDDEYLSRVRDLVGKS